MTNEHEDKILSAALSEITAVMTKHDLGGYVVIHGKESGEAKTFFPHWTTAVFRKKKDGGTILHFKVDTSDANSPENQATILMLESLQGSCLRASAIFLRTLEGLARHLGINLTEDDGGLPDDEQGSHGVPDLH